MSCCMPHMLQNNNDGAKTSGVQGTMAGKVWFGGVTRDVGTSKVTGVLLFCEHCGRDNGDDGADGGTRKRKRTTNINNSRVHDDPTILQIILASSTRRNGRYIKEQTHFFTREKKPEALAMRSFVQPEATMTARILAKQKCIFWLILILSSS
jgi:hypothetical protein